MDNIIDIFNEKMNISKNTTDIKGLEIMMNNISLNNIYIYIYSSNICSPKEYKKDIKYLNLISILVSDINNNNIDITKINPKKLNISNKNIKYKNKVKKDNYYIYYKNLKKRFNLKDTSFKWRDIYNFYTMYNINHSNFMNVIIKSECYRKHRINESLCIFNNNKYISNINIKNIYKNMNTKFSRIFL